MLQLTQLLADLPGIKAVSGDPAVAITTVVSDSRQVLPGALFVAYRGVEADGHRYIPDALARGAVAVVGERPLADLPAPSPARPAPYIQVADGRIALAWLAAAWHGHPSRSMTLVGITGTDGKTTTANLLFNILKAAGRRAGLISTVNAVIGDQTYDTGLHTTTPDAADVQRYLAQMRDAGAEVAVLETTSHGLAQGRVAACAFDVAVVTNITHEHLDFHGTYEAYREAKALLFRYLVENPAFSQKTFPKTAVLNRDDSSYEFLAAIPTERVITYGTDARPAPLTPHPPFSSTLGGRGTESGAERSSQSACALPEGWHLTATNIRHTPAGIEFDIAATASPNVPWPDRQGRQSLIPNIQSLIPNIQSPLVGAFNVSNILAAAAAGLALGVDGAAVRAGIWETKGIPGRMERIDRGQPFVAVVDFAHTPNALARALETVRSLTGPDGRVIVVFGCAGLRDRQKRRLMGEVAGRLADYTVITAEDPRTEELASIMAETAGALAAMGRVEGRDFIRLADRQAALLHAVRLARPGDVVIACGKGHEQSMCFGSTEYPWRDQDALAWALETLQGTAAPDPPFLLPTWTAQQSIP